MSHHDLARLHAALNALDDLWPTLTTPGQMRALETALEEYATPAKARARYEHYVGLGLHVRRELRTLGLEPLAREEWSCPVVTTVWPSGATRGSPTQPVVL